MWAARKGYAVRGRLPDIMRTLCVTSMYIRDAKSKRIVLPSFP